MQNKSFGELNFLDAKQVMKVLGYTSKAAFWASVRSSAIPHVVVNPRRIIFEEKALMGWLESRAVGKQSFR